MTNLVITVGVLVLVAIALGPQYRRRQVRRRTVSQATQWVVIAVPPRCHRSPRRSTRLRPAPRQARSSVYESRMVRTSHGPQRDPSPEALVARGAVMGHRPFRWFPHDGRRHAVPDSLVVSDNGETLCGNAVTIPHDSPSKPQWCWPTCLDCDSAWRRHEGIPPFPRPAGSRTPARRPASRVAVRM